MNNKCKVCGEEIKTMIYKGRGFCGDTCERVGSNIEKERAKSKVERANRKVKY